MMGCCVGCTPLRTAHGKSLERKSLAREPYVPGKLRREFFLLTRSALPGSWMSFWSLSLQKVYGDVDVFDAEHAFEGGVSGGDGAVHLPGDEAVAEVACDA